MVIQRDFYLDKLIRHRQNGMIKVITGLRRSGKSFLLFELFYQYLLHSGVKENHILRIALDDRRNKKYRDPDFLCDYVYQKCKEDDDLYYVLLDEVQFVDEFEDVLNSFLHISNLDVYVTGSNAKFLSKDIITEFRGRGDQIHVLPLSFQEFMSAYTGTVEEGYRLFSYYGGLPKLFEMTKEEEKADYLKSVFVETYLKDIKDKNQIRNDSDMEELLNVLASSIGSLVNPKKLSDTFQSVKHVSVKPETLKTYLDYFMDSFLIEKSERYDVKGKKYISTPSKYYFTDIGLRNARLNFRQIEGTHEMENIIYNELRRRGYSVDVGVVDYYTPGKNQRSILHSSEIDFVCNRFDQCCYIQSAYSIPDEEKMKQEQNSLQRIPDSFRKIIIVKDLMKSHYNENGIYLMSLFDFLLYDDSLNRDNL